MLAYKSLCPSGWTSRWDDQRGGFPTQFTDDLCSLHQGFSTGIAADMWNRGRKLPRKARPVIGSLRRDVANRKFIEHDNGTLESSICILAFCIIELDISNAAQVPVIRHSLLVHLVMSLTFNLLDLFWLACS